MDATFEQCEIIPPIHQRKTQTKCHGSAKSHYFLFIQRGKISFMKIIRMAVRIIKQCPASPRDAHRREKLSHEEMAIFKTRKEMSDEIERTL